MTDHPAIVERLEDYAEDDYYFDHKGSLVTTNRPIALREAAAEITRLREDNKKLSDKAEVLRSVMIAAAEEIQAHWPAHCDAEGYGPANLMRRLEEGIPSQYAYTAGDFERLRAEAEALRKALEGILQYLHKSDVDGNGWICSPIHIDELNAFIAATKEQQA